MTDKPLLHQLDYACASGHMASESTALMKPWCGCGRRYLARDSAVWASASWCWSCDLWFSAPITECPECGRPA